MATREGSDKDHPRYINPKGELLQPFLRQSSGWIESYDVAGNNHPIIFVGRHAKEIQLQRAEYLANAHFALDGFVGNQPGKLTSKQNPSRNRF